MIIGTTILIYMTIKAEDSQVELSDSVKKILLNFLQLVSLAAGLPLQWPEEVEFMFESMETVSSAGSNLLIPDCELTTMAPADSFFLKQTVFTFVVPAIIIFYTVAWFVIWKCCAKKCKLVRKDIKNYLILSIVLILFLCYRKL